jgi:hypothetical protein
VNGWSFDGSDDYLNTGAQWTDGNWSVVIKFSDYSKQAYVLCGFKQGNDSEWSLYPNYTDDLAYFELNAEEHTMVGFSSGTVVTTNENVWVDGVAKGYDSGAWSTEGDEQFLIGGYDRDGPRYYSVSKVQYFALYHTTLTEAQAIAVTNAIS